MFRYCFEYCSVILTFSAAGAWISIIIASFLISLFIYRRRDRSDERPLLDAELMALQALNITVISVSQ
jgi:hypothetical protein